MAQLEVADKGDFVEQAEYGRLKLTAVNAKLADIIPAEVTGQRIMDEKFTGVVEYDASPRRIVEKGPPIPGRTPAQANQEVSIHSTQASSASVPKD